MNKEVNEITELSSSYVICNPNLMDCYNCVKPMSVSKLCFSIFIRIISNKKYYRPEKSHLQTEEERSRIYNNLPIDANFLLCQLNPEKYHLMEKPRSNDIGNLYKRISDIEDENIFYVWKYGTPTNYVFFMERDISVWKSFNSGAFVTKKSLLKVLKNSPFALRDAWENVSAQDVKISKEDLENSYKRFLINLFNKASPDLIDPLISCSQAESVYTYIEDAVAFLNGVDDMKYKINIDDDFKNKLPCSVANAIALGEKKKVKNSSKSKEMKVEVENKENLVNAILPKDDGNLIPSKTKSKKRNISRGPLKPEFGVFERSDPFEDPKSFFTYYKTFLRNENSGAQFYSISYQRNYASEILDMLQEDGRDSKKFLTNWMTFFYNKKLGGSKIKDKDATSLKSFRDSYEEYAGRSFA